MNNKNPNNTMYRPEYTQAVLNLFSDDAKVTLKKLISSHNSTLSTDLILYTLYIHNLLDFNISQYLSYKIFYDIPYFKEFYDNGGLSGVVEICPDNQIMVTDECVLFIDKLNILLNYPEVRLLSDIESVTVISRYIAYLFVNDNNLSAYKLLYKKLSASHKRLIKNENLQYIYSKLQIPNDEILQTYGRLLTDPFKTPAPVCIGRKKEIDAIVDILMRKKKNNPVLIGEPGVGKTAIVEGLALYLKSSECPEILSKWHIYEIRISELLAGARYRGDFEERLTSVIKAVVSSDSPILLFIDEIHTIMTSQRNLDGGMSANDILKPYLARENFRLIGATTSAEYSIIEKDKALERRFSPVKISELSKSDTLELLKNVKYSYESYHNITIPDSSLCHIVNYAESYMPNRRFPDKALDLLDSSCVNSIRNNTDNFSGILDETNIINALTKLTTVPVHKLNDSGNKDNMTILKNTLYSSIIGQDNAIKDVLTVMQKHFLGFSDKTKPIGTFLFVGPTGVGKTQLCKELSNTLYTNESFIRLDMSEYAESSSISKLIGSAPGYIGYETGGRLTDFVKRNPYSVVLFDEIEKAHSDIYNLLLQILDDGRLTDNKGDTIDFTNTIIILTSNCGATDNKASIGFNNESYHKSDYMKSLQNQFSPEFLNRLNNIVVFNALTENDIRTIVNMQLDKLIAKFKEKGICIDIPVTTKNHLVKVCYSNTYGARYVTRKITEYVETPVIQHIVENNLLVAEDNPIYVRLTAKLINDDMQVKVTTLEHCTN